MLRNRIAASLQRLSPSTRYARRPITPWRAAATAVTTTAVFLWCLSYHTVHNDAAHARNAKLTPTHSNSTGVDEDGMLCAVVWGSNRSNLIHPQLPGIETFQVPVNAKWLENMALRDMALHERHAACVDARGDVYQWGRGFFASSESDAKAPKITLRGKNIVKVQLTDSCVFALSASGRIYVFAAAEEQQRLPIPQAPSLTPWRVSDWLWHEPKNIDFVEIFPKEKLNWGETFVSISTGSNHLLALTSGGRTYAHPVNKDANSHGQLGLQKIEIPATSSRMDHSRITVELVPRSLANPGAKMSLIAASDHESMMNGRHTQFSDTLFEIPSLRGIKVSQIATGSRSSFVNTSSGRVLGWGANDHGQIGLGPGITLDSITIPTEIDLARNTPVSSKSKCLSIMAGGDLSCFVVERNVQESLPYVDILCCGNGQWGGLGNNTFSTFQGNPVRVSNVSGLREFDEREQKLTPIIPHAISISPTGHILLSLDTQLRAGPGGSGRDLVSWGLNHDYQLGTGKKTSLNAAMTLERPEGGRFILARRKATVRDISGKIWKKGVEVEQYATTGYGNSVVYWRVKL